MRYGISQVTISKGIVHKWHLIGRPSKNSFLDCLSCLLECHSAPDRCWTSFKNDPQNLLLFVDERKIGFSSTICLKDFFSFFIVASAVSPSLSSFLWWIPLLCMLGCFSSLLTLFFHLKNENDVKCLSLLIAMIMMMIKESWKEKSIFLPYFWKLWEGLSWILKLFEHKTVSTPFK